MEYVMFHHSWLCSAQISDAMSNRQTKFWDVTIEFDDNLNIHTHKGILVAIVGVVNIYKSERSSNYRANYYGI